MMNTLSDEVRAGLVRARLRKSRLWATGLLLAACALFAVSLLWGRQYGWLAYIKAFAEAAMVGGLADWFAVTALFRRPLGLPIPHTAILPRNQERIADELGRFVEKNFLQGRPIALRVYQAQPAAKLFGWLESPATRAQWLPWAVRQLPLLAGTVKPETVARFCAKRLSEQYTGAQIGKMLSDGLMLMKTKGIHESMFLSLLGRLRLWLHHPDTRMLLERNLHEWAAGIKTDTPSRWDKLKAAVKSTVVDKVDDWAVDKMLDWLDGCLAEAEQDASHPIRRAFDEQYAQTAAKLADSPQWHARLESAKMQIAVSPVLQRQLAGLWRAVQQWLADDVEKADSACAAQMGKLLDSLIARLRNSPQMMRRADARIALAVRGFVMRYKDRASQFVSDKVKSWDSSLMVQKLETGIGRDLQFIRINGTIVGGLVGFLIHCVSQWLG